MPHKPKKIWIFGNAVQDITVDVDLDMVNAIPGNAGLLRLTSKDPEIRKEIWLRTRFGRDRFAVKIDIIVDKDGPVVHKDYYRLEGGKKYSLVGSVVDPSLLDDAIVQSVFLPCDNLCWGGGGLNVATFLRGLSLEKTLVPIKYTDIGMTSSVGDTLVEIEDLYLKTMGDQQRRSGFASRFLQRLDDDPIGTERDVNILSQHAAAFNPDRALETYLANLSVDGALYRPRNPEYRRNLVISRFRGVSYEVSDKIVLRGARRNLTEADIAPLRRLLNYHREDVGAILLNSLADGPLFEQAYETFRKMASEDPNVIAVLAMTKSMQEFTDVIVRDDDKRSPIILVFNEDEALTCASKFARQTLDPFLEKDDLPNLRAFIRVAEILQEKFHSPRMYVTLGARGSIGVNQDGAVVYLHCYSRPKASVYDTNACGDAYCAAITLLEWAKQNGYPRIAGNVSSTDIRRDAEEMRYFMAVASAAAYCRATNRRGRVLGNEVMDTILNSWVAWGTLPTVKRLVEMAAQAEDKRRDPLPSFVDSDSWRIRPPEEAIRLTVPQDLRRLLTAD